MLIALEDTKKQKQKIKMNKKLTCPLWELNYICKILVWFWQSQLINVYYYYFQFKSNSLPQANWLKSSPNILENFPYEEFQLNLESLKAKRMTSPALSKRCKSPIFCDTLERHAFMRNVISSSPRGAAGCMSSASSGGTYRVSRYSPPSEKQAVIRRSLEELSKDIKEIEDFLTATENVMRAEKEQDRWLQQQQILIKRHKFAAAAKGGCVNKENKTPSPKLRRHNSGSQKSPTVTYKIHSYKNRSKVRPHSPRFVNSKLYFRNGRIGCLEAEKMGSNIESTHALVKHILKYENEKPLVSPESVRRATANSVKNSEASTENKPQMELGPQTLEAIEIAAGQIVLDPNIDKPAVEKNAEVDNQIFKFYKEMPEQRNNESNAAELKQNLMESEIAAVNEEISKEHRDSNAR